VPTFAEVLRQLRSKAGLTQDQLAEKCGLGLGTIRDYEQGKREPLLATAVKLAAALGTDCRAFAECVGTEQTAEPAPRGRPVKEKPAKRKGR
jgi:transcriptional regulator with XRE-family HTH domain